MARPNTTNSWLIYRGDNKPRNKWKVPPPPSWRPYRFAGTLAKDVEALRARLSPVTRSKGESYRADDNIRRMVNAAIHLRRPLLITGGPGTGKSSLIDSVAYELNLGEPLRWAVSSRSALKEGLYSYDAIGRAQTIHQAAGTAELELGDFIELGPLGTAMLPVQRPRALLIDEIDKADADLPNDLLNVIEEGRFHIPELSRQQSQEMLVRGFGGERKVRIVSGQVESYEFPLVVMTSNGERDFPAPFLRRCLQVRMPDPCDDPTRLRAIVAAHLGEQKMKEADQQIEEFITRARGGELLATDQLLNAIQLVMGSYAMEKQDRELMLRNLTTGLGRKA